MQPTNSTTKNETDSEQTTTNDEDGRDWDAIGYVLASDHRQSTLDWLDDDGPITPTRISEKAGIQVTHVSRTLRQLEDHGLVEVLNPEARKGRLYDATSEGEQVAAAVQEVSA